jgi:small subunit ribosomal protein S7e
MSIAGALYDLETNNADMKSALRPLQFVSAREVSQCSQYAGREWCSGAQFAYWRRITCPGVRRKALRIEQHLSYVCLLLFLNQIEVGHGKKAIVIFVPVPLLQGFRKVQQR